MLFYMSLIYRFAVTVMFAHMKCVHGLEYWHCITIDFEYDFAFALYMPLSLLFEYKSLTSTLIPLQIQTVATFRFLNTKNRLPDNC